MKVKYKKRTVGLTKENKNEITLHLKHVHRSF